MESERPGETPASPPRPFDRQGWFTLAAGALLPVISFTTNYGDDNLLNIGNLPAAIQVGVGLHLAALATLVGVDEVFSERVAGGPARFQRATRPSDLASRACNPRSLAALRWRTDVLAWWLRWGSCLSRLVKLENRSLVLWPVPKRAGPDRAAVAGGGLYCCSSSSQPRPGCFR